MQSSTHKMHASPPAIEHIAARRIPGLDGLRALAVIAVVWHHAHPGYTGFPISRNGFLGVDVFFVLSGFLITTLLLQEERSTGGISLIGFYLRRSLRIFPLYYAVLLLMILYFTLTAKSSNAGIFFQELPWHVTYLSNWISLKSMMAITWSLATEEQFYLAWPPLFAWLGVRAVWLILVFLALNQGINFGLFDDFLYRNGFPVQSLPLLQITFTPILLGVVAAFWIQTKSFESLKSGLKKWMLPLMTMIALLAANIDGDIRGWPRLLFHISIAILVVLVVVSPKSLTVKILNWKLLTHIGTVSYGIYLFHMLVLYVIHQVTGAYMLNHPTLIFYSTMIFCTGLATFSYRIFELPVMSLKSRFLRSAGASYVGAKVV